MHSPIIVNGVAHQLSVDTERTLLSLLRDELGLTGSKYGCGDGKCGACTVHVNGEPLQSCSVTVADVAGKRITTIEDRDADGWLPALQNAFIEAAAFQCGYCTPGMIMSAAALLANNPTPTRAEIIHGMNDNLCRCGAYTRIIDAIQRAAASRTPLSPALLEEMTEATPAQDFVEIATLAEIGEGLIVAYPDEDVASVVAEMDGGAGSQDQRPPSEIGPWLHIRPDGSIHGFAGKAEVGQNIATALARTVAEELRVPPDRVHITLGDTAATPYDRGTFGSRSTPITGLQLRKVGAAARGLLLDLAAEAWGVEEHSLGIGKGEVHHAESGRSLTYGQLVQGEQRLQIVEESQAVMSAVNWTVAGQSVSRDNAMQFVTGLHKYASDLALPDMQYAKILRPPAFHATLLEVDTGRAESMEGVSVIREGDFVGVTAPDILSAERAINALRPRWKTALQISQPEIFDYFKANPIEAEDRKAAVLETVGAVKPALAGAEKTLSRRYTVDFIAHTPLETRSALASWTDHKLTVWTGSQRPFGVRAQLAEAFDLPQRHVRVIVPATGSGFGGKHAGDAAVEAARLARAVGKPVKLVWTREEEFTWAYFRPAGLIEIESGLDANGRLSVMEFHNYNSGSAGIAPLYAIPNQHIEFHPADSPLREGAYRALSSTANAFARESHIDELAHLIGEDPLAFRLRQIDDERLRDVLERACDAFGWGRDRPKSEHGFGLACGYDKGSYVAACVEVRVDPDTQELHVLRVVEAFDCGPVIDPDNLRNQIEGAIIQGMGGALYESIQFANGRILNANFTGYRVPRFSDLPEIESILIDRKELEPAGAGETPIIAIAPAIGNAIFNATGVRLRSMPMTPDGRVTRVPST